ncbi:fucose-specific lectin [Aspergillus sp. HF37]|nr:fucose-specific lectin [Aspergillus sp. HF37]
MAAASEELQRIRVYYLSGLNTVAYDSGSGWTDESINDYFFQVAPYSKITVCFLPGTGTLSVRLNAQMIDNTIQVLYHKSNDSRLVEKGYDAYRGWFTGGYQVSDVPPRAAIAEKAWDNGWHDGILNQTSIPGPEVAVIQWGNGLQLDLRVYFQRGMFASGVSEWTLTRRQ